MATAPTFVFGAGAHYVFGGTAPLSMQEQLMHLQAEKAGLESKLAGALYRVRRLGSQRDTAVKEAAVARSALKQARAVWATPPPDTNMADTDEKQSRIDELENEVAGLKRKQEHDTATIESYQTEVARSETSIKDLKSKLRAEEEKLAAANGAHAEDRKAFERINDDYKEQIKQLDAAAESLRGNVDYHKAAAEHNLSLFNRAFADIQNVKDARDAALQAKDDMEAQKVKAELEHADLVKEWHEVQAQLDEHEDYLAQIKDLDLRYENLQADYQGQMNASAGTDRAVIVKDLRIQELEQQLQREKQRNMNDAAAADEANIAAATSPLHETPPAHSVLSDSLEDELNGNYNDYDYLDDHEHVELALSSISETSTMPVAPAYPTLEFHLNAPVSVTPVEPVRPELAVYAYEPVSTAPKDAVAPTLTRSVNEVGSITPVEPVHPGLAFHMNEAVSVTPIEPVRPSLAIHVSEAVSTTPKDATTPTLTSSITEVGSVKPKDIVVPTLTFSDNTTYLDRSPIAPAAPVVATTATTSTQTEAAQLTYGVVNSASIAVAPIAAALNMSTSLVQVTHEEAPLEVSPASSLTSSPVMVTHEDAPLEVIPALDLPKISKANGTAFPTAPITPVATPTWFTSFRSLLHALLPFITFGLLLLNFYLYHELDELDAWRTANGRGYYGNGGQYRRGDAYGNGISLFGFIPLTKDEGGWIVSELVARVTGVAITQVEAWAGVQHTPSY